MENPRPEKVAVVEEVRERFSRASAALLTEYRGLNVAGISQLRRALRDAGGEYKVYKNTLVRFAARDLGLELDDMLTGPTAVAFVDGDAAAVAKALRDFAKGNPLLVLKGGLLGTRVIDAAGVTALADLPSREQLLSQIAGLFAAPMAQMAGLLDAVPRSFAYGLQALIDQGGAPGAPAPAAEAPAPEVAEKSEPAPEAPAAEESTEAPAAESEPVADEAATTIDTPDTAAESAAETSEES